MKFLHIADVHLGCTRYHLAESPRDFFDAWVDVLQQYAIGEKVDFVVMCGDFFHKKSVPPETMNYAVEGLKLMREAGIPVVTIEGNHDQKHNDSEFSWLRSLSSWGLVKLLEPSMIDGTIRYEPWSETDLRGGFIDIGRARIFGSDWYGASGNWAIPMLTDAIKANRRPGAFHVLLLHTDVEGHQVHPIPALSIEALEQLRASVDYVGLGHTHKHYEIDNWAFNPGSIEVTNISEFREVRGAFVVEVGEDNSISARHVSDYHHRPFQRFTFFVDNCETATEVTNGVLKIIDSEGRGAESDKPQPIVEVALRGRLGFPNSQVETTKMRDEIRQRLSALHVRIKNQTVPAEYLDTLDEPSGEREMVERRVLGDLVMRDSRFKARSAEIAETIIGAKRMALGDEPAENIAEFIGLAITSPDGSHVTK